MSSHELVGLVPKYLGICDPETIIDKDRKDVSREWFFDLPFEAEFIDGVFTKIGRLGNSESRRAHRLFRNNCIHHTIDMSVTLVNERIHKVIDFAIHEIELRHPD